MESLVGSNDSDDEILDQSEMNQQQLDEMGETDELPYAYRNRKNNWVASEDELLLKLIKENGTSSWIQIAKLMNGRTAKQCSNRWKDCLNPDIRKGNWTLEEDTIILNMYAVLGNQWTKVSLFKNLKIKQKKICLQFSFPDFYGVTRTKCVGN